MHSHISKGVRPFASLPIHQKQRGTNQFGQIKRNLVKVKDNLDNIGQQGESQHMLSGFFSISNISYAVSS